MHYPLREGCVDRIGQDLSHSQALNFGVVGDQLRKGAALNGIQIAEQLIGTAEY
jgi:aspartate-semialdehyde dehydrogenase